MARILIADDEPAIVTHRTVDTHVSALRRKLEPDPDAPAFIVGVRGVGYRFEGTFSKP